MTSSAPERMFPTAASSLRCPVSLALLFALPGPGRDSRQEMNELDAALGYPWPVLSSHHRGDQVVHDLCRAEHTRKTGAGMRAGANEVEIRQIFGAIVRAEVRRLGQDRLDGEGRAQIAVERIVEMARVDHALRDQMRGESWQEAVLEEAHDAVAVGLRRLRPIDLGAQMRHRGENVQRLATWGRQRGVGQRRHVQVEREVVAQILPGEDIHQQPLVARAEDDVVMGQGRAIAAAVLSVRSEVDDNERHRIAQPCQFAVGVAGPRRWWQEPGVCSGYIRVADDDIGSYLLTVAETDAGYPALVDQNLPDFGVEPQGASQLAQEASHGLDNGPRAAQGVPDAPLALQIVDQGVDARRLERVSAHQQGVEREDLAQALMLHVPGNEPVDRAIALQAHQVGDDLDHVPDAKKGSGRQFGKALGEDLLAAADERQIALDVGLIRAQAENLRRHPLLVTRVVEVCPVWEEDAIKRIDGNKRQVILRPAAGEGEQLGDQPGRGNDRGSTIEG